VNKPLSDTIVLVADDQSDVARTLCRPLHKAGARLRFVDNGRAALKQIATRPTDLVLVDMKMPPDEWGGLWLLQELQNGGWAVPAIALSGEGVKPQVIQALRLGAKDWIDKDRAAEELLGRCTTVLTDAWDQALDLAGTRLPTPLAYRFARYSRTADPDSRLTEGLHTLEAIFRFAAIVGLSSTQPTRLKGITQVRMAVPSMGTWFDLCTALTDVQDAGESFTLLLSCLTPERSDRAAVQRFISLRNDIAHGREVADPAQGSRLETLLCRFSHRALSTWRAGVAVATSMTYDGSSYCVNVLELKGTAKPSPGSIRAQAPVVAGGVVLLSPGAEPVPLTPWLVALRPDDRRRLRCLQFDGAQRTPGGPAADTPLRYARADDGDNLVAGPGNLGGTWLSVAPWVTAS
jgi:CheY-like chemotaxis protein